IRVAARESAIARNDGPTSSQGRLILPRYGQANLYVMTKDLNTVVDRRALKVLFDTYLTPAGWRDEPSRSISPDDFEYAKRAGVMFDDILLSHADIVSRAIAAVRVVDRRAVANAFVASLSSRRLELRSALGSFAVLQHFPQHTAPQQSGACP